MKRLYVYADASVIGGCEDSEFAEASLALWRLFVKGAFVQVLSAHTLRELQGAPDSVHSRLLEIPEANEAPRGKPRGIYRKQPNTLSTIGRCMVEAWSTSSIIG